MSESNKRFLGAVLMFDLRCAETVSDENIEALVQSLLTRGVKQAERRDLTFEELASAFLESTARVLASPAMVTANEAAVVEHVERLARSMGDDLALRILARVKGLRPGQDDIGEPVGNA